MYKNFINKVKHLLEKEKNSRDSKYQISSIMENFQSTGKIYAVVQIKGTSKSFNKPISELYQTTWLSELTREDVAYISILFAAEQTGDNELIKNSINSFPRKKQRVTKNVVILAMFFITFLLISNLTGFKVTEITLLGWTINFPAALVFFPLTYFFGDILTEVYGFKMSRLIILGGLACSILFTVLTWLTVYLPPSPIWDIKTHHGSEAYKIIYSGSFQIFVASATGYFFGEFLNSATLAKLKVLTSGKYFFLRVIGSTVVGVGVDSILFCNIAYWNLMPTDIIWHIIATQYIFKLSYEILMLPITYLIAAYLKDVDKVDYYDFKTVFNPFSISLDNN